MRFLESVAVCLLSAGSLANANAADSSGAVEAFQPFDEIASDAVLWEQFADDNEVLFQRWKPSSALSKDGAQDEYSYVGKWSIEESSVYPGLAGDKGLVVKSPAARHAISAKFDTPLDNTGKDLVVQYEVKLQKGLECGGAYLKLLSENSDLHAEEFSGDTPYQIMFGPDKCGSTNKVHFIVRRKDPVSGEYEEKHLTAPPPARLTKTTNLYTLIVKQNNDFEIRVNGDVARAGNLLDDGLFTPSFNPPKTVEDPDDVKPEDWVEIPFIPDPEQENKPEDWDEDAPFEIADPDAEMPEDWREDLEPYIADPDAEKPDDWDDEEDGEWIAPEIVNPECETNGCGPWSAPKIRNPEYKGKWIQPMIENPDYKGEWAPQQIPNPDYFEDVDASNLEPIGAIGFELWTMQNDILFDNIYVGHSIEAAELAGNNTFSPKLYLETQKEKVDKPKNDPKKPKMYDSAMDYFRDDPLGYVMEIARVFILNAAYDPVQAIVDQPAVAVAFLSLFAILLVVAAGILYAVMVTLQSLISGSPAPAKKPEPADSKKSSDTAKTTSASSATNATKRKT